MFPRKHNRFAVQLPATYSSEQISGEGTIFDLSTEGCALISDRIPPVHTYLAVHIELPSEALPLTIDLAAVRWASEAKVGLEFIRVEAAELDRLRGFVKTLEVDEDK